MDAGIAVRPNDNYTTYDDAIDQDILIMQSDKSAPLTAGVWPGNAYFPDFMNPNIDNFWHG